MTDDEKKILEPYADVLAGILNKVQSLDAEELAALTKACDAPSETNCWWAIKRAADFLKPIVAAEYGRRTMLEIRRANAAFAMACANPPAPEVPSP